jgi:hypothetical protein
MIDFLAATTIALIVIMTLVIFASNQHQARILKEMRLVMEDWYQAQMRDRRETYREKIMMPNALRWVGEQVNLNIVETGRRLANPPAVEFLTSEGIRVVISPLEKKELVALLRSAEGKRRRVAHLVQPLLGYRARGVQVVERSNRTVHEWFDVEIETALKLLGLNWVNVSTLYFYMIPLEAEQEKMPLVSVDLKNLQRNVSSTIEKFGGWFRQPVKSFSSEPAAPVSAPAAKKRSDKKAKQTKGEEP